MQYRRFGRTELQMPVFSCGGMRYQHSWKDVDSTTIPHKSQANIDAIVRRSLELGLAAMEAGDEEVQLGRILPGLPREKLIVQTKVSPTENPQEFAQTIERSLQNLRLDYVDLFGIHGINTPQLLEWTLRPGGCLEVAQRFQRDGKIRFIGFSTHAPLQVIIQAIQTGQFDYVNLHWYYINQMNWEAIAAATQQDMGVFIISPSDKGGHLYKPPQKLIDLCAPLSPIVFNNLFCLSHPEVHTLSVGAARPSDFDEHIKTLDFLDRADDVLSPILERLEQAAIAALGEEWYRTWSVGLPSHEDIPGGVNIRSILWLRNLAIAFDLVDYAKTRYNMLGNASHWFPGQKADKLQDVDLSQCLANSPYANKIPALLADAHQRLGGQSVQRLSQQD